MDDIRFGLKRRPFPPTLDTGLYYPSTLHESALAALQRGISEDEGLMLLTGSPGTGKTLLGYVLLERLDSQIASAFLTNSHFPDRASLLQAILYDLGLAYEDEKEQVLRLRLTDHLLKTCAAKKRTLLVIDEAHHLTADLLEELRLLANLEAGADRAVQIIMLAQPGLLQTLAHPTLESMQQRLAVRTSVPPLEIEEACDYLLHHIRLAGGKPERIFEDAALEAIARGTHGIPRCLNQVANQALAYADAGELTKVDAEAAHEALATLGFALQEDDAEATHESDALPNITKFTRSA